MGEPMTAADVVQALRERYPPGNRFVFLTEVPFATGTPPRIPVEPLADAATPAERRREARKRFEARKVRRLDVVVMPCWPSDCGKLSRSYPTMTGRVTWTESRRPGPWGFEIKVHRADWLREMKNPAKARPWLDTCQRFYFVSTPGVIRWGEVEEAFPAAGWIEVGKRVTVHREAVVNEGGADATAAAMVRAAWKAGLDAGLNGREKG